MKELLVKFGRRKALLLYNPIKDLPLHVEVFQNLVWFACWFLQKLHSLFSEEADYIHFLTEECG